MTNFLPHLFLAYYNWLIENGHSPHIAILNTPDCIVHPSLKTKPAVVFNIMPDSIRKFEIDENGLVFEARFNGTPFISTIPLANLISIQSGDCKTVVIPLNDFSQEIAAVERSKELVNEIKKEVASLGDVSKRFDEALQTVDGKPKINIVSKSVKWTPTIIKGGKSG